MIRIFLTLLFFGFTLNGCGPSDREQEQQEQRAEQLQNQMVQTTPEFDHKMGEILEAYFELKDAFVESDAGQSKEIAHSLLTLSEDVNTLGLSQPSEEIWASLKSSIEEQSNQIYAQDSVVDQRYHFESLSEAMIILVETFQPVDYEVYHHSCPMVRDGSADWLSREEQIKNPYHGESMINCGETIQQL